MAVGADAAEAECEPVSVAGGDVAEEFGRAVDGGNDDVHTAVVIEIGEGGVGGGGDVFEALAGEVAIDSIGGGDSRPR